MVAWFNGGTAIRDYGVVVAWWCIGRVLANGILYPVTTKVLQLQLWRPTPWTAGLQHFSLSCTTFFYLYFALFTINMAGSVLLP